MVDRWAPPVVAWMKRGVKMRTLLFVSGVIAFLLAALHLLVAKSAIHEIAAYVLFLTSAVLVSGAGVIEAIQQLRRDVAGQAPTSNPTR